MCLTQKKIYTNAHRLFWNRNQPYDVGIPCQECSECQAARKNEWTVRTYYEYLDCVEKGGYAIWDSLSYDEENLPHLNQIENHVPDKLNFSCFSYDDIKDWMKRLRDNLRRKSYGEENIRYIVAGEYGQDETQYWWKGKWRNRTKRPHYHLILFCNAPITPIELSKEIKKAWGKGRTDGVDDRGTAYFWENGYVSGTEMALRVCNYIGKYCLKNQEYDKVASSKIKKLVTYWYCIENGIQSELTDEKQLKQIEEYVKTPEWRKRKNEILRKVKTFHTQSLKYGAGAKDREGVIKDGKIGMPDYKKIYWWQKLPKYYERKIYYNYKKINGKVIWILSEAGKAWKQKNLEKAIESYARKLRNMETWIQTEDARTAIRNEWYKQHGIPDDSVWYSLNDRLFAYRDGRSWQHYAEYIMYHRGRIWSGEKTNPKITIALNGNAAEMAEYATEQEIIYNYCHRTDIDNLGKQMVSLNDLGDSQRGYRKPYGDEIKPREFERRYCIYEDTLEEWHDYDKLKDTVDTINWWQEEIIKTCKENKERNEIAKKNGMYSMFN